MLSCGKVDFFSPLTGALNPVAHSVLLPAGKIVFDTLSDHCVLLCICRLLLTGDFLGNMILWTVSPFKEKHKPVCRWDYLVQDDFDHTKWKRSTPTTVAFHPAAHTLFIGGTSGEFEWECRGFRVYYLEFGVNSGKFEVQERRDLAVWRFVPS